MEQEIDLRDYIKVLLGHWKLIIALALLGVIAGYVVSSLLPASYEASAVVIVTEPRYQLQFDPRFETAGSGSPAYEAFPTLATSDGILQAVVQAYQPSSDAAFNDWRLRALQGMAEASSAGDPSLVILAVHSKSSEDAAGIANTWADIFTKRGNDIYGESEEDVTFFENQATDASLALDNADAALVEFEARNRSSIIEAQLESRRKAQSDYLDDQLKIAYIIQDIEGLRDQLAEQPTDDQVSLADNLTALLLQIKAFNAEAETAAPLELQVDSSESISTKSLEDQVLLLDDLVATLEGKSTEIDTRLKELTPQILALQQELQQITTEGDRLNRVRDLAGETYLTLARKVDEARIAAEEKSGILQVGSYAITPEQPTGPRKLVNAVVIGLLGLVIGIVAVLFIEYWHEGEPQEEDAEE